ncbi:addiction module protein [Winogradskyella luteola]|uniref:Addiction module protein n=1 Tax=Winogradskyella luteola TaxID=2828330 RepID=A0A9X1FB84_9FLAO|nr:addiction module protein [Winogradskyella luteola]MBV7270642.1 addiction module protein [Winogradskyella luteola]
MGALELREKLIEQFNLFIQDDSKLLALDGIFDSITTIESDSVVSEDHYKIVESRREKRLSGQTKGKSWEEVKGRLKAKYGF